MIDIKKFVEKIIVKYRTNFQKYTIMGVIFSLLEVFFLWIFIDLLKKPTLAYTVIIVGVLTILKFYSYVSIGMMKNRIFRYLIVLGVFYILDVVFIWMLVKIGFSAALSSALMSMIFFILRFLVYDKVKLLKY